MVTSVVRVISGRPVGGLFFDNDRLMGDDKGQLQCRLALPDSAVQKTGARSMMMRPTMAGRAGYDTARLTVTHAMAIAASPISAIGQITWTATETGMSCRNTPRAITSM